MITPYVQPQTTITEHLRSLPARSIERNNTIVIGPEYLIGFNDGDRAMQYVTFSNLGDALPYTYFNDHDVLKSVDESKHAVDRDNVRLYGEDLEVVVGELASKPASSPDATDLANDIKPVVGQPNALKLTSATHVLQGAASGTSKAPGLDGRDVQIGDTVKVFVDQGAGYTTYHRVNALIPITSASKVSAASEPDSVTNFVTNTPASGVEKAHPTFSHVSSAAAKVGNDEVYAAVGGRYNGALGEYMTVVVKNIDTSVAASPKATFLVSYATKGSSETIVVTGTGATATVFKLALTSYTGTELTITADAGKVVAINDSYKILMKPAFTATTAASVVPSGTFAGTRDTQYVVEVVAGGDNAAGAVDFQVYDTAGIDAPQLLHAPTGGATAVSIGTFGVAVTINVAAVFATGDKFIISCQAEAASGSAYNGIRLTGAAVNAAYTSEDVTVTIIQKFNGRITAANYPAGDFLAAEAETATYSPGLGMRTARVGAPFQVFLTGRGKVTLSWRAVVIPLPNEGPFRCTSAGDAGEIHLRNDLGYGVFSALSGSQGKPVYALRTLSDSSDDYATALDKIESSDIYYSLAVLSDDIETQITVMQHCEAMSQPNVKNFRRCYAACDSPGEYPVMSTLPNGVHFRCTTAASILTLDDVNAGINFLDFNIDPGDFIIIAGDKSKRYEVAEVASATSIVLVNAPATDVVFKTSFAVWKPDTAKTQAEYVIARSKALASRRAVHVWCDGGTTAYTSGIKDGSTQQVVPNKFLACEIAGLRSAMLPQQGLTYTEVQGISAAPTMYTRFKQELLNDVAANGTMIVTQSVEGGEVYIRHQLTTAVSDGSLFYEDNAGIIVDDIAYDIKDGSRGFIGKKNATTHTIEEIRVMIMTILQRALLAPIQAPSVGPMILGFEDRDGNETAVTVTITDMQDTIDTYSKVRVPLPLNYLNHYIDADINNII